MSFTNKKFITKFFPEKRINALLKKQGYPIETLMQLKSIKSKISETDFEVFLTKYVKSNDDSIYFSPPTDDTDKYREADIKDKEVYLSERITISSLPCRVCKSTNTKSVEASNRGMDEGGAAIVDCLSCGAHYREA